MFPPLGALCLTEDARHGFFSSLAAGERSVPAWTFHEAGEPESLFAHGPYGERLLLLSGFQAVTREGLEVLALATTARPADRRTLAETVAGIGDEGGVPVLPWAFGKWWFGRGAQLGAYLSRSDRPRLFLGDNAGRAPGLPGREPDALAAKFGLVVLPGSDPLPLAGHEARAGSYGFCLDGDLDLDRPARWFRDAVAGLQVSPPCFGGRSGWLHFLSDQLRLRREKVRGPRTEGP